MIEQVEQLKLNAKKFSGVFKRQNEKIKIEKIKIITRRYKKR